MLSLCLSAPLLPTILRAASAYRKAHKKQNSYRPPPRGFYSPLARQARIAGDVRFEIVIATDGEVRNLTLLSGHPLLVPSATEAPCRTRYSPTIFFKLANSPPSP